MITERCLDVDSGARNADAVISDWVLRAISDEILARMARREAVKSVHLGMRKGELRVSVA